MKLRMLVVAGISLGFTCTALAVNYSDLQAQGYRWVTVDGPFACTTEQEVQRIAGHRTDATELEMVENLQAYYLIPGTIVKVVQEDRGTGMSQIQLGGITSALWTYTKYLSKQPIEDTYGVVETPENTGLIPSGDAGLVPSAQEPPVPSAQETVPLPTSSPGETTPNNPSLDTSNMNPTTSDLNPTTSDLNPTPSPTAIPHTKSRRARGIHQRN
jgi:hypothetical protein